MTSRRRSARLVRPAAPRTEQLARFPEAIDVRPLDARAVAGAHTRGRGVWRVRYEREAAPHRVFFDRHGWYCEARGRGCRAAAELQNSAAPCAAAGASAGATEA